MSCYSKTIENLYEYRELSTAVDHNRLPMGVLGLSHIHKAHFIHSLCDDKQKKALVIVPDEENATRLRDDLCAMGNKAEVFPAADLSFRPTQAHSRDYEQQRLGVLSAMLESEPDVVICSAEAALQLTVPPQILRRNTMVIGQDSELATDMIADDLTAAGYVRCDLVEGKGQFSVRGGLIDVFPPSSPYPVRIELWGDEVDNIAYFDPDTQRRTEQIGEIRITPATSVLFESTESLIALIEKQIAAVKGKNAAKVKSQLEDDIDKLNKGIRIESLDRYIPLLYGTESTVFDYAQDYLLIVCETSAVKSHAQAAEKLMQEDIKAMFAEGVLSKGMDTFAIPFDRLVSLYEKKKALYFDNLTRG
ncbi:MAG TPA: transcription-repair coupling factor, partial [Ruminococcaceae bacterium]|nr:transcription-repair coupling factor [Oscillospiraceae bacterium]